MKRTGLVISISVFCLLFPWGAFCHLPSVLYAQDESIDILTYYPAPYAVYRDLEVTNRLEINYSSWEKMLFTTSGVNIKTRLGSSSDSLDLVTNAYLVGTIWHSDDDDVISLGYSQNALENSHDFYVRLIGVIDGPATSFWTKAMRIDTSGSVGIGEDTPAADRLDISTTVNSLNTGFSNLPFRIRRDSNVFSEGTGIGFTCSTDTEDIGAKIVFIRSGLQSRGDLAFYTKPDNILGDTTTEKMRITDDGRVGIGEDTPAADKLDIKTTVNSLTAGVANLPVRIRKASNTNNHATGIGFTCSLAPVNIGAKIVHRRNGTRSRGHLAFYTKGTTNYGAPPTEKMRITYNGRVGIGVTSPSEALDVNGSAYKSDGWWWAPSSDIRLKKDIKPIENPLNKISQLRGVMFKWKEPEKHCNMTGTYMGLISQDAEKVFPEWVGTDSEGYKTLCVTGFEALVTEAIKELKIKNNLLKSKNAQLEERIKKLEEINRRKQLIN